MKKIPKMLEVTVICLAVVLISCGESNPSGNETPLSSEKAITAYAFTSPAVTGVIDENAKTIAVQVPEATDVKTLVATFTTTGVSATVGSTVQVSGTTSNDFTTPVVYTVIAEDNSTVNYSVTVTIVVVPKAITSFSFSTPPATGTIDEAAKTIFVNLPDSSADLTALVATFTTTGASVSVGSMVQTSGSTPNDFTNQVVYTVKGTDNSTTDYTVNVMKPANWTAFDWTTSVEPPTGWGEQNSMNTYCSISDGILSFNSGAGANQAHYRYYFTSPLTLGSKMTIAFKAKADGDTGTLAWMLDVQSGYRGQLEIRNGRISLLNGTSPLGTAVVTASGWHTYLVSYQVVATGLQIKVYVDGTGIVALLGIATTVAANSYIRLGDMSGNNTYMGSIDWIIWTFDGAYVPGVNLPEGFSLVP